MKKFLRTLWSVVWPLLIYAGVELFITTAVSVGYLIYKYQKTGDMDLAGLSTFTTDNAIILTAIVTVAVVPLLFLIYNDDNKRIRREKPEISFGVIIFAIIGAVGAAVSLNTVISILGIPEYDPTFELMDELMWNAGIVPLFIAACMLAPLCEELLFRGIVCGRIGKSYGYIPAMILSSFFFGIFHGNLTQFVYASVIGFIFAFAYCKTGRLIVPVIMHMAANMSSVLSDVIMMESDLFKFMFSDIIVTVLEIVIGGLLTVVFFIYFSNRKTQITSS